MSEPWLPAEHGTERRGLQRRVARGLTWTLIETWGGQLLGLLIFVVLVGLLQPADIGLVALAAVFVALAQLFVDQGLGDALIQRPALTRSQIDTAFWTAVATGSVLTVGGFLLASPIAAAVAQPRLGPILQVLALSFLLTAFSSVQMALLRREMAFRSLALRRLVSLAGGGAVGVTLAYLGFGAGALVAQQLVSGAISVVALWTVSPWRPGLRASVADFRTLFTFGINIVAGDFLFFLSRNVDSLLIGTVLGPTLLGFYAVGHRFLDTSTSLLVNAARKLVFPAFSRLQHDPQRLRRAYLRMTHAIGAIILPGFVGLALVAQEAIVVVVGERWAASGPVAAVLFLIGPVLTVQAFSGSVLSAVGHPEVTLRFRFLSTITNVLGFGIAVLFFREIVAVAAAYTIRGYVLMPLMLWWMKVYVGIPIGETLARLRAIVVATMLMAAGVVAVKLILLENLAAGVVLVLEVVVGMVVYGLALFLLERGLVSEISRLALQVLPGGWLARRVPLSRVSRSRQAAVETRTLADEYDDG